MITCLVRGSGDIGSAVAHVLYKAGYAVALHDVPAPTYHRRGMAFLDALFDGRARLEGIDAYLARDEAELQQLAHDRRGIGMASMPLARMLEALDPHVLIDARMRKREVPETQRGLAALVVGMGPNFVAGDNADVVIETAWGPRLGTVIERGGSMPFAGEPRMIDGHSRERFVYAPLAGTIRSAVSLGKSVSRGQLLGFVDSVPIGAPLSGVVVGLTRDGVQVRSASKIAEVDPRGEPRLAFVIGERATAVAAGVLHAVGTAFQPRSWPRTALSRSFRPIGASQ